MAHTCFTRMQKYCAAYVGYDVLRDTIVVTAPTALKNENFFWHNILPESWIIKRYKSWSISPKYSNVHLYLENKLIFSHKYILTFINNYYLNSKNCKTSCILLAEIYHYHILRNVLWSNLFMNHLVLRAKFVGLDCLEVLSK